MQRVQPLHDRVLIQRVEEEKTSSGGIIIPDSAQEKTQRGKVVSVGAGKQLKDGSVREMSVKEGDEVIFGKFSGTEIKISGTEYLIMREDELLGKVGS